MDFEGISESPPHLCILEHVL